MIKRFLAPLVALCLLAAAASAQEDQTAGTPAARRLSDPEREYTLAVARVSFNEANHSEPDQEMITQVVEGRGHNLAERLHWLRAHSRCVMGVLTQDRAYARPGNCRWTRNLMPDGRRPRGWDRALHGPWSPVRVRWRAHLRRQVAFTRGELQADICPEAPDSWDGVRYGRETVAPAGSSRRILECDAPYTSDPTEEGLHNFAVAFGPPPGV